MSNSKAFFFRATTLVYSASICAFLIVLLAGGATAGTFTVFGPETFKRQKGKPKAEIRSFSVMNPNAEYLIKVYNGGLKGSEFKRISSAVIEVNGIEAVGPKEFKQSVNYIEKRVVSIFPTNLELRFAANPVPPRLSRLLALIMRHRLSLQTWIPPQMKMAGTIAM